MKILAPIAKLKDAKPLLIHGVDEFYGGILLDLEKKYHIINSINRRHYEDANFKDMNDLTKAVQIVNDGGADFFIAVNAPYYILEQYSFLEKYIEAMIKIGVSGFIIS